MKAGFETVFEVVGVAIGCADDGGFAGEVIHEGEEADLADVGDFVGFFNPDDAVATEHVGVAEVLGDFFDGFDFDLGAVEFCDGEFAGLEAIGGVLGEAGFADARGSVDEEFYGVARGREVGDEAINEGGV